MSAARDRGVAPLPARVLNSNPPLSQQQRRAIWAITHCRTRHWAGAALRANDAAKSTSHAIPAITKPARSADARPPLVGSTASWAKIVGAPYFLVTFTLPSGLPGAPWPVRQRGLRQVLCREFGGAGRETCCGQGTAGAHQRLYRRIHTWNQRMEFIPTFISWFRGPALMFAARLCAFAKPITSCACLTCRRRSVSASATV